MTIAFSSQKFSKSARFSHVGQIIAVIVYRSYLLLHLYERCKKQNQNARDRHRIDIPAEAGKRLRCARVRDHQRTDPQYGVEPESHCDHPNHQDMFYQHQNSPKITQVHESQIPRVHQHEISPCDDEDE